MSQVSEESLEVLGEKWSCRCGFIGDTAEEVWEHQEDEMRECEESDCSGRMDECGHCPEIATGDAQREPLVSIHDVRERLEQRIQDRSFEDYFGDRAHLRVALEYELERIIEEEFMQKTEADSN